MSGEIEPCQVALFFSLSPQPGGEGRVRGVSAAESTRDAIE